MNVLIIEDHPIFIQGLRDLVKTLKLVDIPHTAENIEQAILAIESNRYSLIFLDLNMPGLDGLSFIKMMKKKNNFTPIAVISSCDDEKIILQVIQEGAVGFIPKSYSPEKMGLAIQSILAGNIYLPEILQKRSTNQEGSLFEKRCNHLGIRKKPYQVLKFLSEGYTNKEIARELNISIHTVKAHLGNLSQKLNTTNRLDTVMEAKRLGLL